MSPSEARTHLYQLLDAHSLGYLKFTHPPIRLFLPVRMPIP